MSKNQSVKEIVMICGVCPEGQKLTGVDVIYNTPVEEEIISADAFRIEERTITGILRDPKDHRIVHIELSVSDEKADLTYFDGEGPDAVWKRRDPQVTVKQVKELAGENNKKIEVWEKAEMGDRAVEPLVDKFTQHVFHCERTGRDLPYNLYLPENYDENGSYPLLMFIHDRGPLSSDVRTTLRQGIGAVCWVTDDFQKKHPSIILAPQYERVPDKDGEPDMLETTYDLYQEIIKNYAVDKNRLYGTGQSMGCMSTINMSIRRHDLFTAMLLVAGQWDAEEMKVLHDKEMLIIVSRGDPRAFAGMNESLVKLDDEGAQIQFKAVDQDNGHVPEEQMQELLSRPGNIHYAVLKTKLREFSCHMGTWQVAYGIDSAKEWLFSKGI